MSLFCAGKNKLENYSILWACLQETHWKCTKAASDWVVELCACHWHAMKRVFVRMCTEVRTELITLSEKGSVLLPRQHASKHPLLLGKETSITIMTFPNGCEICLFLRVCITYTPQIHKHILHSCAPFFSVRVCMFAIQSWSLESFFQVAWRTCADTK